MFIARRSYNDAINIVFTGHLPVSPLLLTHSTPLGFRDKENRPKTSEWFLCEGLCPKEKGPKMSNRDYASW